MSRQAEQQLLQTLELSQLVETRVKLARVHGSPGKSLCTNLSHCTCWQPGTRQCSAAGLQALARQADVEHWMNVLHSDRVLMQCETPTRCQ